MKFIKLTIIKIAAMEMLEHGVKSITLENLCKKHRFRRDLLKDIFTEGDNELLLEATKYLGQLWLKDLRDKIKKETAYTKKVRLLILGYAMGTREHSQSLSVYIDLWKMIKDTEDTYIIEGMKALYYLYMTTFVDIVKEDLGITHLTEASLMALASFMTGISDAIHIQSIIFGSELKLEQLSETITELASHFLLGEHNE